MVGAVVAVRHLQGPGTAGQGQQLVAQADAEQRHPRRQEFADRGDGVIARRRIAGAVGQENAIGLHRQHLRRRGLGGHHGDLATALGEHAQDVGLHPEIVGHDLEVRRGGHELAAVQVQLALGPGIGLAGADHPGQVHAAQARELARCFQRLVHLDAFAGHQRAILGAAFTQDAGELAGVDAGDGHHPAREQPVLQRGLAAPAAGATRHVAHDQARRPDLAGLVVLLGATGVADVRIGQGDQLACIGRIGEDLLVAGHGGVEHHLTDRKAAGAYGLALEHGAVFEDQDCGLGHVGSPWNGGALSPAAAGAGLQETADGCFSGPRRGVTGERELYRSSPEKGTGRRLPE